MKQIAKGLAVIAFLAIAGYGLTQFLKAQDSRRELADAERYCAGRGGVDHISTESGQIKQVDCMDGSVFTPDAVATPRE